MSKKPLRTLSMSDTEFYMNRVTVDADIGWHDHRYIELAYIQEGALRHRCNGAELAVPAGRYLLIDHGLSHDFLYAGRPATVLNCMFSPGFFDPTLGERRYFDDILNSPLFNFDARFSYRPLTGAAFTDSGGLVLRLLLRMEEELRQSDLASIEMIRALLTEVIILTLRQITSTRLRRADDAAYVHRVVRTRYSETLRLEEIARELNVSADHLGRKLKAAYGCSFTELLQTARLEAACRLLAGTGDTVAGIAARVGYQDVKFFRSLFTRRYGMTPAEYRRC